MFFLLFFVLGFQLHFFPLRSRFDAFHFLGSQKNRRVWRPSNSAKNGLSGSYSSRLAALAATDWRFEERSGAETMWASTKDMSTRVLSESCHVIFQKCSLCMFNGLSLLYQLALGFFSLGEVLVVDWENRKKIRRPLIEMRYFRNIWHGSWFLHYWMTSVKMHI